MKSWRAIIPFSVFCAAIVCAPPPTFAVEAETPAPPADGLANVEVQMPPSRQDGLAHGQIETPASWPGVFVKEDPPPMAVERAARFVALRASVRRARVEIVDHTVAHWVNESLGIPEQGRSYPDVIVPGYRVILRVRSRIHEARTNLDGSLVKLNPAARDRFVDSLPLEVRENVARYLTTDVKSLRLVLAERVTWSSLAVGCPAPPLSYCVRYPVAGYRLIFERADGLYVELHTDRDAHQIRACRR